VSYVVDPGNPYPARFTGHVRVTLRSGEVREASQDFFRGGKDAPMSTDALEAKFRANCAYGGWTDETTHAALAVLRDLGSASTIDLRALRA